MPLTWLVTGCSSGFGAAFVSAIIARGDNCIATGRDIGSKLAHLEGSGAALLELDVTSPQTVIDHQIGIALRLYGRIDVLINNAGYMMSGFVEELTYVWERIPVLWSHPSPYLLAPGLICRDTKAREVTHPIPDESLWISCRY